MHKIFTTFLKIYEYTAAIWLSATLQPSNREDRNLEGPVQSISLPRLFQVPTFLTADFLFFFFGAAPSGGCVRNTVLYIY